MAAPAPTNIAMITGRWSPLTARAVKKAPSPAIDACPREMWPENPVMHTIDVKITSIATICCA